MVPEIVCLESKVNQIVEFQNQLHQLIVNNSFVTLVTDNISTITMSLDFDGSTQLEHTGGDCGTS